MRESSSYLRGWTDQTSLRRYQRGSTRGQPDDQKHCFISSVLYQQASNCLPQSSITPIPAKIDHMWHAYICDLLTAPRQQKIQIDEKYRAHGCKTTKRTGGLMMVVGVTSLINISYAEISLVVKKFVT